MITAIAAIVSNFGPHNIIEDTPRAATPNPKIWLLLLCFFRTVILSARAIAIKVWIS